LIVFSEGNIFDTNFSIKFSQKNLNRNFRTKIPGVFSSQNFAAAASSSSSCYTTQQRVVHAFDACRFMTAACHVAVGAGSSHL
jgi:hypothetical protein